MKLTGTSFICHEGQSESLHIVGRFYHNKIKTRLTCLIKKKKSISGGSGRLITSSFNSNTKIPLKHTKLVDLSTCPIYLYHQVYF